MSAHAFSGPVLFYRLLLALVGIVYAARPLYQLWVMYESGVIALGTELYVAAAACAAPLLLASPIMFAAIKAPSRWYHFFAVFIAIVVLTAVSELPTGLIALEAGFALDAPIGLIGLAMLVGVALTLATLVMAIVSIMTAPTKGGAEPDAPPREMSRREKRKVLTDLTRLATIDAYDNMSAAARMTANLHNYIITIGAVFAFVGMAFITYWHFTGLPQADQVLGWSDRSTKFVLMALAISAVLAFGVGETRTSGGLFVPLTLRHWLIESVVPALGLGGLLYLALPAAPMIYFHNVTALMAEKHYELAMAVTLCGIILPFATWTMTPKVDLSLPSEDALRPYSTKRQNDVPEVKKLSKKERAKLQSAATVDDGKLPTIGAAMKLYIGTDWIVMRLLGMGLLATAYLQWTFIQQGREFFATQLAQGLDPMHALYFYAGFGALLAVPFMLPLFIVRPSHVIGGLVKAGILVAAGLILLPMTHVAIDMFFTDLYRPTLHATVPRLFKAIMGVAVTSALLISFFRQLGKTPKVDYMGRAMREYSAQELSDMRRARMELQ
ncbi:MAG: hypothetical protein AAFY65_00270 [Pseudomonadota bacterium]